jgi:hypothetical protein
MTRPIRELLWAAGCAVGVAAFVGFVMLMRAGPSNPPRADEWAVMFLALFGIVTAIRTAAWAVSGRVAVAALWPEVAVVIGVCVAAFGLSGDYSDEERAYIVIGAGIAAIGALALLRARRGP